MLAGCTPSTQQASNSPEASPSDSPSPVSSPTPVASPTPTDSPTPAASPTPDVSPSPATLLITRLPFHVGEVGITYSPVALGASGGTPPYKWSIATGTLPPGLSLSATGSTTGKPTTSGSYSFVVRVDDASGGAAGVPRTVSVVPHLSASGLCTNVCIAEEGCITVCGKLGTQSGGLGPFRYQADYIPPGMALSGLALAGPMAQASSQGCDCYPPEFKTTVSVTDALGATATVVAYFGVYPHITINGPGPECAGFGCSVSVFYSGGDRSAPTVVTGNVNCTQGCSGKNGEPAPNTLPPGFSATASGGTITVTFPGGTWVGTFDLTIYDQSLCGPQAFCVSNTVSQSANVNAG